ncbi:hypothetical protein DFJ74DRAFT_707585 [Hyaloraphidium curvatum]|nr:hypothetical protein DFJ74DRAFT_707585 [Hyaloraphidium curvatum]
MEALENAARDLCASHGIDLIDPHARAVYEAQMAFLRLPPEVNMLRVTGRPERADQRRGEWGYADDFDESKLPHAIRTLVDRIREQPGLALGKPRDVTINQRRHRFFRLDPHIDPQDDGGSIFICSVTAGTVLTLSPLDEWKRHEAQIVAERDQKDPEWAKGLEWIRSTRSYTREFFFDVLSRRDD